MKKTFAPPQVIAIILLSMIFAGCQTAETPAATPPPAEKTAETTSKALFKIEPSAEIPGPVKPATTTEPSAWTAEETDSGAENEPYLDIYFVALEDNGKSGPAIGCGDSIVSVKVKYALSKDESTVKDTLTKLFAVRTQYYGGTGLYNALYQSDLKVDSLTVDAAKKATLKLTGTMLLGGVCDNPRFEAQIRSTVLQFKNLYNDVEIFVNGKPLKDLLSEK